MWCRQLGEEAPAAGHQHMPQLQGDAVSNNGGREAERPQSVLQLEVVSFCKVSAHCCWWS